MSDYEATVDSPLSLRRARDLLGRQIGPTTYTLADGQHRLRRMS